MNKYKPHLLVLPEDQANNDILNGFLLHDALDSRAIQPLPLGGGWPNVRRKFISEYAETMRNHPNRHVVLLVDFDKHDDRYAKMMEACQMMLRIACLSLVFGQSQRICLDKS